MGGFGGIWGEGHQNDLIFLKGTLLFQTWADRAPTPLLLGIRAYTAVFCTVQDLLVYERLFEVTGFSPSGLRGLGFHGQTSPLNHTTVCTPQAGCAGSRLSRVGGCAPRVNTLGKKTGTLVLGICSRRMLLHVQKLEERHHGRW